MTRAPGRPLSAELSEQLLSVALDILADEGWGRLNSDRVAARARAGKAGIYRRWPTMSALARAALTRVTLVPPLEDHGSLRADVLALVAGWSRPLDRGERAAGSLVGPARHDGELRAGLEVALTAPLSTAVSGIGARSATRGEPLPPARLTLLCSVLEALWWKRLTAPGDGAMPAEQVEQVVDEVLVPILRPSLGAATGESDAEERPSAAGLSAVAAVI